ncbi:claudin-6-like [Conger conger]|uniref:claudin-6-like n=1 Tax=Conger conger TaxID=82655 RepID=UPI002A5AC72F|nr:claudin-6-like [Conger conger]
MASTSLQILGLVLALLGWAGGAMVCAAPLWRVTAFIGNSLVRAQVAWEGLWMSCVVQSTGEIQCKAYDSVLALPGDLQAARVLCLLALMLCALALALGVLGAKCTRCLGRPSLKARVGQVSGALFVLAGFLYLIPICWTAHAIIRDFYDPAVADPHKRELGPALFLGWGMSALLLIGGALLVLGSAPPGGGPALAFGSGRAKSSPVKPAEGEEPGKGYV